jgi:hypothetical protein
MFPPLDALAGLDTLSATRCDPGRFSLSRRERAGVRGVADDMRSASATRQDILKGPHLLAGVFEQSLQLEGMVSPQRAAIPVGNH